MNFFIKIPAWSMEGILRTRIWVTLDNFWVMSGSLSVTANWLRRALKALGRCWSGREAIGPTANSVVWMPGNIGSRGAGMVAGQRSRFFLRLSGSRVCLGATMGRSGMEAPVWDIIAQMCGFVKGNFLFGCSSYLGWDWSGG